MSIIKVTSFVLGLQLVLAACSVPATVAPVSFAERYANEKEAGHSLVIRQAYTRRPNSAGGVDVGINILNLSDKTIKYINYTVVAYNAVGDRVQGEIRRRSEARLLDTGPIGLYGTSAGTWDSMWYNYSITCMEITRLRIEYMDGSTRTYSNRSSIATLMSAPLKNSCRV